MLRTYWFELNIVFWNHIGALFSGIRGIETCEKGALM